MARLLLLVFSTVIASVAMAEDISLTVEEYDPSRQRASLLVLDTSQVPLGTVIRVHSKTGTCEVKITEQVNDHLIGITRGCETGVITAGMKLAYSQPNTWESRTYEPEPERVSTRYNRDGLIQEILQRTSVFVGHSFASQLEGNVYSDGSIKDLDGDTAFSLGIKGRVYDFTDRISLTTELGYETPRTLDQATYQVGNAQLVQGTLGFSPRLSLWSLAALGEIQVMDRMNAFAGLNFSIPSLGNSPFDASTDIGFQAGANYQIVEKIAIEGLVKVINMNLENNIGQTTDVSLAGLELRGRYSF